MNKFTLPLPDKIESYMLDSLILSIYVYVLFAGQCRRDEFIEKMICDMKWNKKNAMNLWKKGSYISKKDILSHPYISISHKDFISIRSHRTFSKIMVSVPESEFLKIQSSIDMKHFLIWLEAGRPRFMDKINKSIDQRRESVGFREYYLRSFKSITLNGLAKKFGISSKYSMCRTMKSVMEKFGGYKTSRFTVYNGKLARLSNIYSNGMNYRANKRSRILKNNNLNNDTPVLSVCDRKNVVKPIKSEGVKLYADVVIPVKKWFKDKAVFTNLAWMNANDYKTSYEDLYNFDDPETREDTRMRPIESLTEKEKTLIKNCPELFVSYAF